MSQTYGSPWKMYSAFAAAGGVAVLGLSSLALFASGLMLEAATGSFLAAVCLAGLLSYAHRRWTR